MMTQGEANTISVGDTVKSMGETRSMEKELKIRLLILSLTMFIILSFIN